MGPSPREQKTGYKHIVAVGPQNVYMPRGPYYPAHMLNSSTLKEKRAVVCGASRGIGRAAAYSLAGLGAQVIAMARDTEALRNVAADLPGSGHRALATDMSDPAKVKETISETAKTPVHILVNNSGGPPAGPVLTADPQAFEDAFTQHVIAGQLLAQAVIPGMKAAGYGRIINIISTSVKQPIAGLGVSNTIRGAVASWAKTLSREVAPFGITVNNVLPGFTDTERLTSLIETRAQKENLSTEAVRKAMLDTVPAGRFGKPEELGDAVAFLASPAAGYINGINLPIDGGRLSTL